tara:strand:- start:148 stop:321 length:174 start_codon:yes stop_codon:yes gene_type:complete
VCINVAIGIFKNISEKISAGGIFGGIARIIAKARIDNANLFLCFIEKNGISKTSKIL